MRRGCNSPEQLQVLTNIINNYLNLEVRIAISWLHRTVMSTVCLPLFLSICRNLSVVVGYARQPEALFTGADRETGVCAPEVGARVQGVPRQHGRLHESSGLSRSFRFRVVPKNTFHHPSLPTPKSFKTVNPTGLWARSSSGTIGYDLFFIR